MNDSTEQIQSKTLYIVPTPIGNLEDITLRAIKILSTVDIIACEDTRHTGNLLKLYEIIPNKLISYHDYNEKEKSDYLIKEILEGKSIALVSDCGTPGISDPGYRIINEAVNSNIKIIVLPGATAFVPALIGSGCDISKFTFFGFPPQKKGRLSFLKTVVDHQYTSILYESPYRIIKLLDELAELCSNDRKICLAKEISKIHETYIRGTIQSIKENQEQLSLSKGEFIIIIEAEKI